MLISTCYKPATTHRDPKIVATSYKQGWRSLAYDPALSASDNHLAAANKLAHALGGSVSYGEYGQMIEGRDEATFHLTVAGKAGRPDGVPPSAIKLRDKRSDAVAYAWRDSDWQTLILFGDEEHARHCGRDEATIDRLIRHAFERRQSGAEARLSEARIAELRAIADRGFVPADTVGVAYDDNPVTNCPSTPANDNDHDPDGGGSSALPPRTPIEILTGVVEYALVQSQAFNGAREALATLQAQLAISRPVLPATRPRGRKGAMTAEQFFDAYQTARTGVSVAIGERWVTLGFGRWATVPTGLRSFKGARGGKVTLPRDIRVPPAQYWPGTVLPEGLILAPEPDGQLVEPVEVEDWRTGQLVSLHPIEVTGWLCHQNADLDNARANHRQAMVQAREIRERGMTLRIDRAAYEWAIQRATDARLHFVSRIDLRRSAREDRLAQESDDARMANELAEAA